MNSEDLCDRFRWHAPSATDARWHEYIRAMCMEIAIYFNDELPEGRESSLALTKIEEAAFWAHASLARST